MPDNKLTDVPENNVGKMSDNEIVNDVEQVTMALEYCVEGDCEKCPYDELTACNEYLKLDAVKVINRLQAEKQNLEVELQAMRDRALKAEAENEMLREIVLTDRSEAIKKIKSEAYKECIEKIKALFPSDNEPYQYWEIHEGADNLLKELVGEE